jgi:5-methylthioadenosine/S-adenosylhomocysteine deaminase
VEEFHPTPLLGLAVERPGASLVHVECAAHGLAGPEAAEALQHRAMAADVHKTQVVPPNQVCHCVGKRNVHGERRVREATLDGLARAMDGRLLFKNCTLLEGERLERGRVVVVVGGRVTEVGPDAETPALPGDWAVDAKGRLLVPGRVDAHARLTAPDATTAWSTAEVEALAAASLARALRAGVTCVFEHLSGVVHPAEALATEALTAERLGIRLVAAHATGGEAWEGPLEANVDFVRAWSGHPLVRGALGLSRVADAPDPMLDRVASASAGVGAAVHLSLAETDEDLVLTYKRYGLRTVQRLARHGLLGPRTVAAHARGVDGGEARVLAERQVLVAWSPLRDLLAEGHGFEALWIPEHRVALGTSGVGTLPQQWDAALAMARKSGRLGRLWAEELVPALLLGGGADLLSDLYGAPAGRVAPGALADLVLLEMLPVEDVWTRSVAAEVSRAPVGWTVVEGRVVLRDGQLLGTDALELEREAVAVRRARR